MYFPSRVYSGGVSTVKQKGVFCQNVGLIPDIIPNNCDISV